VDPGKYAAAIVVGVALAGAATPARAQKTEEVGTRRSAYEDRKIAEALATTGRLLEESPEGKIVEAVEVVPLEVIELEDPAPRLLNVFHTTTRPHVLAREVMLPVGQPYRQYRVDESVRSLRSFQQLSLVLAVAVRGSAPDRVRVLLVTKDVWSIRPNFDLRMGAGGVDLLRFEPTERNIAGRLDSAVTRFELLPETVTLGAAYIVPRLGGLRVYSINDVNAVVNRRTGDVEGSFGRIAATAPLLSSDTPFVWGFGMVWLDMYARRYVGARLATFDAPSTPEVDRIPDFFHARHMTQTLSGVWSIGRAHKLDVSLGAELSIRQFVGLDPSRYAPDIVEDYRRLRVPTSDDRAAPWAQVRAYESRFVRLHDYDVLALQEDYRVGYDTWLRAYPVTRALGSTRSFLGLAGVAQYTTAVGDGLARAMGEVVTELQPDDVPTVEVGANLTLVSPRFFLGRIILDGVAIGRPRNYLNHRSGLGGEGRLRGYPSGAFLGENLVTYNAELRTRPLTILACQVGGAAFFDVGDAFDGTSFAPKSSAGFGVRGMLPQLDRKVMRFDVAFPLVRDGGEGPVGFYLSFEQAFPAGLVTAPGVGAAQALLNPLGGALQ